MRGKQKYREMVYFQRRKWENKGAGSHGATNSTRPLRCTDLKEDRCTLNPL